LHDTIYGDKESRNASFCTTIDKKTARKVRKEKALHDVHCHCEQSEAIPCLIDILTDRRVASLLAMT
jgi:hypothetical protein